MDWKAFADDKRDVVLASTTEFPLVIVIKSGSARVEVGSLDKVRARYTAVVPSELNDDEYRTAESELDGAIRALEDHFGDVGA
jgi:hypothetical protein